MSIETLTSDHATKVAIRLLDARLLYGNKSVEAQRASGLYNHYYSAYGDGAKRAISLTIGRRDKWMRSLLSLRGVDTGLLLEVNPYSS